MRPRAKRQQRRGCHPRAMTQTPPLTAVAPPASLIRADHAASAGSYPAADRALLRIRPAVYTVREQWDLLPEWDRYLLRVHAYATVRGDAMFSHESAAALLGLPFFGHPRDIHVFDSRRTRSLRFGDVAVHTSADPRSALHLGVCGRPRCWTRFSTSSVASHLPSASPSPTTPHAGWALRGSG